jgi:hypothetical protein
MQEPWPNFRYWTQIWPIGGHVFAKRKFIQRRKESFVHRKEQSLESLTQRRKEIIARRPRWSRW